MRIQRGAVLFGLLAVALAAVFIRLGFWQLDRLEERRRLNAVREERLGLPPVRIPPHPDPSPDLAWRRAEVRGRYDFGREVVLRGRLRNGRPGIELLTPLRPEAGPAVFVHRGWLPAADGLHAPLDSARSAPASSRVVVRGTVMPGAPTEGDEEGQEDGPGTFRVEVAGEEHLVLTRLDPGRAAEAVPYPVAPYYVRADDPAGASPVFRSLPPLAYDEGPHLGYAIQWFAFAAISVVGAGIYLVRG